VRQLADAPLALRPDLGEEPDVAPAERRIAAHELEELLRGPASRPQPAHHAAQQLTQFARLVVISYHRVTIIGSEERR